MTSKAEGIRELESRMRYSFKKPSLLEQALTHRSFYFESKSPSEGHNERLEFLGDAVLDLVVSDVLMRLHPSEPEGVLSKWRASLVNETRLSEISRELQIGDRLKLGRGETQSFANERPRLLASALEAVIGALYVDGGFDVARQFVETIMETRIAEVGTRSDLEGDYKTRLQELLQKSHRVTPTYVVVKTEGPDHEKTFEVEVSLQDQKLARGRGYSRKQAEQDAARVALEQLSSSTGGGAT